jgi:hypothetical protein
MRSILYISDITLLSQLSTFQVELAQVGRSQALDKVLFDTTSSRHNAVDLLVFILIRG